MDGCPDCQNVEKLLNDNSIASKYRHDNDIYSRFKRRKRMC